VGPFDQSCLKNLAIICAGKNTIIQSLSRRSLRASLCRNFIVENPALLVNISITMPVHIFCWQRSKKERRFGKSNQVHFSGGRLSLCGTPGRNHNRSSRQTVDGPQRTANVESPFNC
jgi:hypothetical protein